MSTTFKRLPTDVIPLKYKISLNVDLVNFKFSGSEDIDVKVNSSTNSITLNSSDLDVTSVKFNGAPGTISIIKENETVVFAFENPLTEGNGVLSIAFNGELIDNMKGFYRSKYQYKGETKYMATTQFEPTDARRAFPCWDEPAHKAVFVIDIAAEKQFTILSNSAEERREEIAGDDNKQRIHFAATPIMSTYLVAFVIGELDFVEDVSADGVKVRVYTSPGNSEKGKFALDIACRTLPFYKEYFHEAYPLPKLDLIAIPDFAAGAMENWGLVTYRETALLVDPKESSAAGRQRVAIVVGHELAHQWFGNLVTMEWWTDLWLNEGFASWIEYLCVDYCCPDYDIWTQFVASDFADALELDALKSSHPIEVEVVSPSEIDEIFDRISYSKGASIIRMLQNFMGAEVFKKGLQSYLSKYKYTNARTASLWQSLEEATNGELPVGKIMTTWTSQMGYPCVTVSKSTTNSHALKFSQKQFQADGSDASDKKSIWHIPITLCRTDDGNGTPIHKFVLDEIEKEVVLPENVDINMIRVNPFRVGFFRVNYADTTIFANIKSSLNSLSAIDRLAIPNDSFALARAGMQPLTDFLSLVPHFTGEKDYTVWSDLISNLLTVRLITEEVSEECQTLFNKLLHRILEPVHVTFGWDPLPTDKHTDQLLRSMILSLLGRLGHDSVVETGRARFESHISGEKTLDSNLRAPVYSMVIKHGDGKQLQQLEDLLAVTELQEERVRILRAMGSVPLDLISRIHAMALDGNKVRKQDCIFVLLGCCHSRESRIKTWNFVKENWSEIYGSLKGLFLLGSLVKGVIENFVSDEMYTDIKTFFETNESEGCQRAVQQGLETVQVSNSQLKRDGNDLLVWLRSYLADA